jgi:predicted NBD/HSP70 family sugar kinase
LSRQSRGSSTDLLQFVREAGPVSRTDLARLSGLAVSTVSLRVEELIASGLVEEAGDGRSRGGRRPRMLRIRSGGGVALAADLGTQHARLLVVDMAGAELAADEVPVTFDDGPGVVLTAVSDRLAEMAREQNATVLGVGMGLPGPVDPVAGLVTRPSRMPGWHGLPVGEWLSDRFGAPAAVDNDANLLALGEYRSRWAQDGVRHLVAVKIGRGVGCGIIADGAVHHGANGAAGDISHVRAVSLDPDSARLCECGRRGCLETLASGAAVLQELAAQGTELGSTAELIEQVHRGDPDANLAVRNAGWHIGEVLSVVVNFFNPQVLTLGGSLAAADPLVAAVRAAIYERCLPMASEAVTIVTASDAPGSGVHGAAWLILDRLARTAGAR